MSGCRVDYSWYMDYLFIIVNYSGIMDYLLYDDFDSIDYLWIIYMDSLWILYGSPMDY